jgi:mannose-6-phosphate isomerase
VQHSHGSGSRAHEERPWGEWWVLDEGEGWKVKRLEVRPQKRLSYQTHEHRAELWIIVAGVATCTVEGRTIVGQPGDCIEIGVGVAHRIANQHDDDLVIVEVQRGSYTGEDDICRLHDDYGRIPQVS